MPWISPKPSPHTPHKWHNKTSPWQKKKAVARGDADKRASVVCGGYGTWSQRAPRSPSARRERIRISRVHLGQICSSCFSSSLDHIRGAAHWWSLILLLKKGEGGSWPTKKSKVSGLKSPPGSHLLQAGNIDFTNDKFGVKISFLEQCWWSGTQTINICSY